MAVSASSKAALHLPTEILTMIFENVRGDFDSRRDKYPASGIYGIQNLRLTCKQFCNASSHLLLHRLDLLLTTSSLEHLVKVSHHPTISKGIRSLEIHATLYDSVPAESLHHFIAKFVRTSGDTDASFMQYMNQFDPAEFSQSSGGPSSRIQPAISGSVNNFLKLRGIIDSCRNYLSHFDSSQSNVAHLVEDGHIVALRPIYTQYKNLVNSQMAVEHRIFTAHVAEAVGRLPTLTGLSITDFDEFGLRHVSTGLSDAIYTQFRDGLRVNSPTEMVPLVSDLINRLSVAVIEAGISLRRFRLSLEATIEHEMIISDTQADHIVRAAQHLKVLDISCQMTMHAFHSNRTTPYERLSLSELACQFWKSESLSSLDLCCHSWKQDPGAERLSAGPSLSMVHWTSLKKISLAGIAMHCHELENHINELKPGTHIVLEDVCLLSGCWADLLDVLRKKADCNSTVTCLTGNNNEEEEVFKQWEDEENPASAYITRQTSRNPLRSLFTTQDTNSENTTQDNADTEDVDEVE